MRRSGTAVALGSWPDGSPAWLEARRSRDGRQGSTKHRQREGRGMTQAALNAHILSN